MKSVNLEHLQFVVASVTDEVQRHLGRPITAKEIALVFSLSLEKLSTAELLKANDERMSLSEVQAYAELIAAAYSRTGRNPTSDEDYSMQLTARDLARSPNVAVH